MEIASVRQAAAQACACKATKFGLVNILSVDILSPDEGREAKAEEKKHMNTPTSTNSKTYMEQVEFYLGAFRRQQVESRHIQDTRPPQLTKTGQEVTVQASSVGPPSSMAVNGGRE